jgi:hypothetical protein
MKIMRRMLSIAALLTFGAAAAHAQATVTCKDGSSSKGGQGACSGHGGVSPANTKAVAKADAKVTKADAKADAAITKADAKASVKVAKADAKAATTKADAKAAKTISKADAKVAKTVAKAGAPTATCKDGTSSYAKNHTGACASHGGVKAWLDGSAKKP